MKLRFFLLPLAVLLSHAVGAAEQPAPQSIILASTTSGSPDDLFKIAR
jgi:hypothetical protein